MRDSYQVLIKILHDNFGVFIYNDEQEDFAINDYIPDSLSFIQFIIAIEEEIEMELPDDFLDIELLSSAKGFAEKINSFINFC